MGAKRIDHIGIAVSDIDSVAPAIRRLLSPSPPHVEEVEDQGVRTTSFRVEGGSSLEFLESLHDESPVGRFLKKRGTGIHHIALEVENLPETLAGLKREGVALIDETPRRGAEGKQIAFIHPKSAGGILIELCSAGPAD